MINSSFQDEINKINRYGERTEHSLESYVKNLETLMVLQFNNELKTRKGHKSRELI